MQEVNEKVIHLSQINTINDSSSNTYLDYSMNALNIEAPQSAHQQISESNQNKLILESNKNMSIMEWPQIIISEQESRFQYEVFLSTIIQTILSSLITGPLTGYILQLCKGLVELMMILAGNILRASMIGARYGTIHPARLNKMYQELFPSRELDIDFTLGDWKQQNEFIITKEILHSILRNELDLSLFYFEFLQPTHYTQQSSNIQSTFLLEQYHTLEAEIFPSKYYTYQILSSMLDKATPCKPSSIFGLTLCYNFIQTKTKSRQQYLITSISILLSTSKSLIPFIIRHIYTQHEQQQQYSFLDTSLLIICNLYNITLNSICFRVLLQGIIDMQLKAYLMQQLSNLISPLKNQEYECDKIYPTIDFFNKVSVKAWNDLRSVFLDYGQRYYLRHNVNMTLFLIYHILLTIYVSLQYFRIIISHQQHIIMIVCIYELLITFIVLSFLMYYCAVINDHFRIHSLNVDRIKYLVSTLLDFTSDYFHNNSFESTNVYLRHAVHNIQNTLGTHATLHDIQTYLKELFSMLNHIAESINTDAKAKPVKLLGATINYTTIGSILAGLGSLLATSISKFITKY